MSNILYSPLCVSVPAVFVGSLTVQLYIVLDGVMVRPLGPSHYWSITAKALALLEKAGWIIKLNPRKEFNKFHQIVLSWIQLQPGLYCKVIKE